MPVVTYRHLVRRSNSAVTITIFFSCVAGALVLSCAFWSFILPKLRRRWCQKSSRIKNNGGLLRTTTKHTSRPDMFLTHSAAQFPTSLSDSQHLSLYNPRYETPFAYDFTENVRTRTAERVSCSAPEPAELIKAPSTNGLFTPIKHVDVAQYLLTLHFSSAISIRARSMTATSILDCSDAKNFILAVPEPLEVRNRAPNKPPALVKHLHKYKRRNTISGALSEKDLHPNKLLSIVLTRDSLPSECGNTSMEFAHDSAGIRNIDTAELTQLINEAIEEEKNRRYPHSDSSSNPDMMLGTSQPEATRSLAAINRLKTYRSLTGAQMPRLGRRGTLTRPKTPVGEMRKRWDTQSDQPVLPTAQAMSSATLKNTPNAVSDRASYTTSSTTPLEPSPPLIISPTPLCPHRPAEELEKLYHDTPTGPHIEQNYLSISCDAHKQSPRPDEVQMETYKPRRTTRKSRPSPIRLVSQASFEVPSRPVTARAITQMGMSPLQTATLSRVRCNLRASSLYSRDTHGFSIIRTPTTPVFFSAGKNPVREDEIFRTTHESPQSIKARISHWTQRIEGFTSPTSTTSAVSEKTVQEMPAAMGSDLTKSNLKLTDTSALIVSQTATDNAPAQNHSSAASGTIGSAPGGALWI